MRQRPISFTVVDVDVPFKLYLQNLVESLEKSSSAKLCETKEKRVDPTIDDLPVEADSSSGGALEIQSNQSERATETISSKGPNTDFRGKSLGLNIAVGEIKDLNYAAARSSQRRHLLREEEETNVAYPQNQPDPTVVPRMYTSESSSPRKNLYPSPFTMHPNINHLALTTSPQMSFSTVKAWPPRYQYIFSRQQAHVVQSSSHQCCRFRTDGSQFCTDRQPSRMPQGLSQLKDPAFYTKGPNRYAMEPNLCPDAHLAQRRRGQREISYDPDHAPSQFSGLNFDFSNCRATFLHSCENNQLARHMKQQWSSAADWRKKTAGRCGTAHRAQSPAEGSRVAPDKTEPVRKYKCDVCEKAFSRSNTLVTHRRIHTGDKPFCCDVCGRAFRQPGNLTRHRLTHTAYKPFVCHVCSKAFNRSSNLSTHLKLHSRCELD